MAVTLPNAPPDQTAGIDRRGISTLAAGHMVVDATTGALPALLPVFTAIYALSDLAASMIVGASLLVSSAIQPLFGLLADRRATPRSCGAASRSAPGSWRWRGSRGATRG